MAVDRRKDPEIFIEGIDVVIRRDLDKHKALLVQTTTELESFREAAAHESARKRHYYRQIGKGKFNDDALRRSVKDIRVNIRHLTDKAVMAEERIEHHKTIIDTLTEQLREYDETYATLNRRLQ
jgi:chromosome segregation ATPase